MLSLLRKAPFLNKQKVKREKILPRGKKNQVSISKIDTAKNIYPTRGKMKSNLDFRL
jgi:hypothetical protein